MISLTLEEVLFDHLHICPEDISFAALKDRGAIHSVNRSRDREKSLQSKLHPGLVRRLDAGFARSNTVHPDTGHALYTLCTVTPVQNVFETGTYWGFSTAYLAAALQDKGAGKVYTFDIYDKAGSHIPRDLMSHVELHRGKPSVETLPVVLKSVVPDLFFQDSLHDYEGVKQELEIVVPHLKRESIILFHDFVLEEVRRAAQEVLPQFGYHLYLLETQDPQQLGVAIREC